MTIVHIVAGLEFGGVAEVAAMLALHQRKLGHAVRLVTVARPGQRLIAGAERAAAAGVELVRFAPAPPAALFFSWRMMKGLGAVVQDADVVHVHSNWTFPVWWGCRTALRCGKRLVMTPHGCLSPERLAHSRWKKRAAALFDRHFLRRADVLHATCEAEARDIGEYCDDGVVAMRSVKGGGGGAVVVVVPNGVDVEEFQPKLSRGYWQERFPELGGRRVVLALGRLHPLKGLDLLLEAWGRLPEGPQSGGGESAGDFAEDWVLVVAGPDEQGTLAQLRRQAGEAGLEPCVRFAGAVPSADRAEAIASAHFLALPSRHENFGLTVVEALACGVPVIATRGAPWSELRYCGHGVTAMESYCGHGVTAMESVKGEMKTAGCGWWVDVGVEPLAEALREALGLTDEERRALGVNGRKLAEAKYQWSAVARQMLHAYERMLAVAHKR